MFKGAFICVMILILNGVVFAVNLRAQERDPFVSPVDLRQQRLAQKATIDLANVVLKGVIWNNRKAVAIINDELVMVGDEWQGFKVERVDTDSVTINDGMNSYRLSVQAGAVAEEITPAPETSFEMPELSPGISEELGFSLEPGEKSIERPPVTDERLAFPEDEGTK